MKKWLLLVSLLMLNTGCWQTVPAGNVGIIVNLYGGEKGVSERAVGVGRYWVGYGEELYVFPTALQNVIWTASKDEGKVLDESIKFQDMDGLSIEGDIGVTYGVNPEKVTIIFQKFRKGIDEITDTFLRNTVRNCLMAEASHLKAESLLGEKRTEFMVKSQTCIIDTTNPLGITVEKLYLTGNLRPPKEIIVAITSKIAAVQDALKIENEIKSTEASAKKQVVEAEAAAKVKLLQAEAESKSNAMLSSSLTTTLLELERLKVERARIEKWNGSYPATFAGSGTMLLKDLK